MSRRGVDRQKYIDNGVQRRHDQVADGSKRLEYRIEQDRARKKAQKARFVRGKTKEILGSGSSILSIILSILLVSAILGVLMNRESFTFAGLLEILQNCPQIDMSFLDWSAVNLGDWGAFNFFRDFLGFFIDIFNILAFVGTSVFQVVAVYVPYFFRCLFL